MDYIKAIADVHSISVAAENLGISQPALSAHLKKKEQELNAMIFDRSKQPLQLTEAGKAYLEYIDQSAALERKLHQRLNDIEGLKTGKLTVGGASFINVSYLPKAVKVFSEHYPDVEIEVMDGKIPEITTAAWNGLLDVFITPTNDDPERFHYEELLEETICLAVPADWEINQSLGGSQEEAKVLTKEDFQRLCEYPFVVLNKNQDIGRRMEALFQHFGCRPERVIKAEQTLSTIAMTISGAGISLVSKDSLEHLTMPGKPILYIAEEDFCRRKLYVAYPKSQYLSNAAAAFIDVLKGVNQREA
ncbi:MAG: LysR family transcriptional regulator [Firmicutes bacterium]|nr:LysR family transcriptional regulator [Bacillota bacterium]